MKHVAELLGAAAERAAVPAFMGPEIETWSYGGLAEAAWSFAGWLHRQGIGPGERVVLCVRNSPAYGALFFGSLRAGCVAVPLPVALGARALERVIAETEPRLIVTGPETAVAVRTALAAFPAVSLLRVGTPGPGAAWEAVRRLAPPLPAPPGLADLAVLLYTSGSSGPPKAVMLTHGNLLANTRAIVAALRLRPAERVLAVLPFQHAYGQSLLLTQTAVAGTLVLENRTAFPELVVSALSRYEVNGFAGVPSTYAVLLQRTRLTRLRLPRLRYLTQAGGPMPIARIRRLHELWPDKELYIMYGATEATARLTVLPPEALPRKWGSVGLPVPGVEIRIAPRPDLGSGIGEILARGPNIMRGYWRDPEGTTRVLSDGWYHTGDLGYVDEEGFLYVLGRADNVIKVGGYRVSLREIEETLSAHPAVAEAICKAVPDPLLEHAVAAWVVPAATEAPAAGELLRFLRERLEPYKVPRFLTVTRDLPRTATGKVRRDRLEVSRAR